jgi:hypothetical protein
MAGLSVMMVVEAVGCTAGAKPPVAGFCAILSLGFIILSVQAFAQSRNYSLATKHMRQVSGNRISSE